MHKMKIPQILTLIPFEVLEAGLSGSKILHSFETRKYLIINIFGLVQGASYIYKYILAPCTKKKHWGTNG